MQNWVRREAPENFEHFWLIYKAKSLMFWREAPKKIGTFEKIIALAGKISKKITLVGRFQNFGCRPSLTLCVPRIALCVPRIALRADT